MVRATMDCPLTRVWIRVWLPTVTTSVTVPDRLQLALSALAASSTCRCSGRRTATPWGGMSRSPQNSGWSRIVRRTSPLPVAR
ncbi:hypothetical protein D3C81_1927160 [compost metagenome]